MTLSNDAKTIAVHFVEKTSGKATKAIMSKTIIQAKSLLSSGYELDEVIKVIDYIIDVKHVDLFSLGYINTSINNILREINKKESLEKQQELSNHTKQEIASTNEANREEVMIDVNSTERNQNKLNRFGIQPRFGEEFNINMFKE